MLAVLFEDTKEQRHVKTYTISIRDKVGGTGGAWEPGKLGGLGSLFWGWWGLGGMGAWEPGV